MVGAYGVSGGTSQQDEEMAQSCPRQSRLGAYVRPTEPKASVKEHINELYAKAGITDRKL